MKNPKSKIHSYSNAQLKSQIITFQWILEDAIIEMESDLWGIKGYKNKDGFDLEGLALFVIGSCEMLKALEAELASRN